MKDKDLILKKNREIEAILDVSRVLTSSFDLEGNLTAVMEALHGQLEMQRGCVFLVERATGGLHIVAAYGLTREEVRRGTYRIGEGIVGGVIESGEPMFVPDIGEEPKFLNRTGSRPSKDGISFLSVPIRLKDRVMGALSVDRIYSAEEGGVDDDLRVLTIVASLIAQFVTLWEHWRAADEERQSLRAELKDRYSMSHIVGESERFQSVLKSVRKVAGTDATVLLLGESGTGKELVARAIHFESRRAKGPFVAVNCAAIPGNLLEVELFGCEKGAFTGATAARTGRFEVARGGTIFLDEIGDLPLDLQAKLLRVLQERSFERVGSVKPVATDVRVIAATNRDLEGSVHRGEFRDDLYWRLNVVPIVLPPLRERASDIPLLVEHYASKFGTLYGKALTIAQDAMEAFAAYAWPGNVRELANTMERVSIMAEGKVIGKRDLPLNIQRPGDSTRPARGDDRPGGPLLMNEVEALEEARIIGALREHGMVQHRAASALGITARQLGYRIRKYKIDLGRISLSAQ